MFFRFYILGILGATFFLFTSVWAVSFVILMWFLLILIRMPSYYQDFKKKQFMLCSKSLSFFIKSMRRQKLNFRIINFLIRQEYVKIFFKKLSILLDDINVKRCRNFEHSVSISDDNTMNQDHYYNPSYSGYSFNIHNKS